MFIILRRELQDHIQSIQFVILLIVTVTLFIINGYMFGSRYQHQIAWYSTQVAQTWSNPSTVAMQLPVAPTPLLFVAEGGDKYRPAEYLLQPRGVLSPTPNTPRNHKMPDVPELDWAFIVKIIFSMYVLLLSFDAICGEKERGTLRQMFSNPVGRMQLLLGKYGAILLTVAVPLLIGLLCNLIIMGMMAPAVLSVDNLSRILLLVSAIVLFLSLFIFLGLFISSIIHQSAVSLLVLLVLWV